MPSSMRNRTSLSGGDENTEAGETHFSLLSMVNSEGKYQWNHKWACSLNPKDPSSCKDNDSEHDISESR